MHLGDHRLGNAVHRLHQHGADLEQPVVELRLAADHLGEVVSGRERRAGAFEHDRADLGPLAERAQGFDQLLHQLERERVSLVRAVERDPYRLALLADLEVPERGCEAAHVR